MKSKQKQSQLLWISKATTLALPGCTLMPAWAIRMDPGAKYVQQQFRLSVRMHCLINIERPLLGILTDFPKYWQTSLKKIRLLIFPFFRPLF
jgi:hypothetical protein